MNGHSIDYEIAMEANTERQTQEQPEWYALNVNGTDVIVDTSDACERHAVNNYPLSEEQFHQLCDRGFVRASDDTDLRIDHVDRKESSDAE
jgi:hypothetical protein